MLLLVMLAIAFNTHAAEPLNLDFSKEPLKFTDFVNLSYGQILHKNYVFDDSFVHDAQDIKINLKNFDVNNIDTFIDSLKRSYNFDIKEKNGVYIFYKTKSLTDQLPSQISDTKDSSSLFNTINSTFPSVFHTENSVDQKSMYFYHSCKTDCTKLVEKLSIFDDLKISAIKNKLAIKYHEQNNTEKQLKDFLEQFDTADDNYTLKAYLYEFGTQDDKQSAFQVIANFLSNKASFSLNKSSNLLTNVFSLTFPQFSLLFTNLQTDSRFSLLSNPSGSVNFGQTFSLNIGQQVPVLGQIVSNGNGQTTQSVDYRDSGVIFGFTPKVLYQDSVLFDLNAEISSFIGTQAGSVTAPTLNRRAFKTSTAIHPGEIIVVGGFKEYKSQNTNNGVFGISLGHSKSNNYSELLLFLQLDKNEQIAKLPDPPSM